MAEPVLGEGEGRAAEQCCQGGDSIHEQGENLLVYPQSAGMQPWRRMDYDEAQPRGLGGTFLLL